MSRRDEHFPAGRGQPGRRAPSGLLGKLTWGLLRVVLVATVMISFGMAVLRFDYPVYDWGQRTTVTVETPEGPVSGSAVVKVWWEDGPVLFFYDAPHVTYKVQGEATVVDLGGGKYLFALIKGAERLGLATFGGHDALPRFTNALVPLIEATAASMGESREIPEAYRPLLVTFDDIDDPASVRRVDPDDLATSFGPGYALASIKLAITDEPVTKGRVEAVLGWLGEYPEPKLGPATGQTTNIPFNRRVAHGDFIRR